VVWCVITVVCHDSAVGLDAGRGTTPVTGVASARHRASGATASITDFRITWFEPNQLRHAASLAEATCEV